MRTAGMVVSRGKEIALILTLERVIREGRDDSMFWLAAMTCLPSVPV